MKGDVAGAIASRAAAKAIAQDFALNFEKEWNNAFKQADKNLKKSLKNINIPKTMVGVFDKQMDYFQSRLDNNIRVMQKMIPALEKIKDSLKSDEKEVLLKVAKKKWLNWKNF